MIIFCNCSSCHCLIHDVMLWSQNKDLWRACANGDVAEVKGLISLGGDVNSCGGNVSCVSLW